MGERTIDMIAIIPARGGSKGLLGKNVMELNGKPLIAYTIDAALKSKGIDRVIVSTDSEEIAEVAKKWGAEVPFMRPPELASDSSQAIDTYLYTIERFEKEFAETINSFVVLLPTCPLRHEDDIDNAIQLFYDKNADSIISYTEELHPIKWHKYIDKDGKFEDIFDNSLNNRQDYRTSYYPNGAIYVFSKGLIKKRKYYGENSFPFIMPHSRSVDIDTIDDFIYADFLLKQKFNNEKL